MKIGKIMDETNEESKVLYSAVVLGEESKTNLLNIMREHIPNDWNLLADHMTIAFGKGVKDKNIIGREANLLVTHWAISDKVIAVRIRSFPVWLEVENAIPHITVAVNPYGGKPVMSNYLTKWQPLKVFVLNGIVMEIRK